VWFSETGSSTAASLRITVAGFEQLPRVGMATSAPNEVVCRHFLYDLPSAHDRNSITHVGDHRQVMAYQYVGHPRCRPDIG
jgi:hypothetical protein